MTRIQEVTITKIPATNGGSMIKWNFDLNGKPFGQVWTYKNAPGFGFRFHILTLGGIASSCDTFKEAEAFMREQM